MSELKIKTGDSFLVTCTYSDDTDQPIDLTGYTIDSHIKDSLKQRLVALEVQILNQTTNRGKFILKKPDNYQFPVGIHSWDIQYTLGSQIQSTETMKLNVVEGVTD